jgi:hypothetical protein
MCDASDSAAALNEFLRADQETHTVTVSFGNHMNWGRWQFSTGRVSYVTAPLLEAGVSCQLKFLEGQEDRDKVVVSDLSGNELAAHEDMLHNRNYRLLKSNGAEISQKVLAALGKDKACVKGA